MFISYLDQIRKLFDFKKRKLTVKILQEQDLSLFLKTSILNFYDPVFNRNACPTLLHTLFQSLSEINPSSFLSLAPSLASIQKAKFYFPHVDTSPLTTLLLSLQVNFKMAVVKAQREGFTTSDAYFSDYHSEPKMIKREDFNKTFYSHI